MSAAPAARAAGRTTPGISCASDEVHASCAAYVVTGHSSCGRQRGDRRGLGGRRRGSALVGAHELRGAEHVAAQRALELVAPGALADVERLVEGAEPEEVAVRPMSVRRARAAPPGRPEVVAAFGGRRLALRQSAG